MKKESLAVRKVKLQKRVAGYLKIIVRNSLANELGCVPSKVNDAKVAEAIKQRKVGSKRIVTNYGTETIDGDLYLTCVVGLQEGEDWYLTEVLSA